MIGDKYILGRTGEPVVCEDIFEWSKQFEATDRVIDSTAKDDVRVSTVFLGLDHSCGQGRPVLFETMIFGGKHDQWQDRYCTRAEAVEGHKKACILAFGKEDSDGK